MVVYPLRADVAQLVEHNLAKVGVAGSNPVVRSIDTSEVGPKGKHCGPLGRPSLTEEHGLPYRWRRRQVVRQRPAKPLSPVRIRASPPGFDAGPSGAPGGPAVHMAREVKRPLVRDASQD